MLLLLIIATTLTNNETSTRTTIKAERGAARMVALLGSIPTPLEYKVALKWLVRGVFVGEFNNGNVTISVLQKNLIPGLRSSSSVSKITGSPKIVPSSNAMFSTTDL